VLGKPGEVFGCPDRVGKRRSGIHLDGQTHGFGNDEDVAEDDGSVEEALEPTDGLHRQLAGDLRGLAAFEKGVVFPDGQEF
jgi:hypothetical protein